MEGDRRRAELRLLDLDRAAPVATASLSGAELARAAAMAEPARRRFAAGRAALRATLAGRLGCAPGAVPLATGPWGKPVLADRSAGLAFSLAHCGRWALLAVAPVAALGVDLERVRPLDDPEALAERLLDPAERLALARLPAAARGRALLRAWVREEACRKAVGTGLLDRPPGPARRARADGLELVELEPGQGLVAALAASEPLTCVRLLRESATAGVA
jgi:4'-phosphopantetheinyl transferase